MRVDPGSTADQVIQATDGDGDPLSFWKAFGPSYMTVTTLDAGSGMATGNIHLAPPELTPIGSADAGVVVGDGIYANQAMLHILISDNPPVLDQPADMVVAETKTEDQELAAYDLDEDPLTFTLVDGPSFVTITTADPTHGNIHLAPGMLDAGVYRIMVAASDGIASGEKSLLVTVNNTNAAPVLTQPADMTVNAGEIAEQSLTATDIDGQRLNFFKYGGPAFVSVTTVDSGAGTATGTVRVAPRTTDAKGPDIGPRRDYVIVEAGDGVLLDAKTFWVSVYFPVDNPPVIDTPVDMTVTEGMTVEGDLTGSDPDGDAMWYSKADGPDFVTISGGPSTGYVRLSPSFADSGSHTAIARVTDFRGLSNEKPFRIQVNNANAPPRIQYPTNMLAFVGHVAEQDVIATDLDGNPLSFHKIAGPGYMTVLTIDPGAGTATGRIRLAPTEPDLGTSAGAVGVSDGSLGSGASFKIDVRPPGTPVLLSIPDVCTHPGAAVSFVIRAVDPEGDRLLFSQMGLPSYASLTDNGNGTATLVVTPDAHEPLGWVFTTVSASDGTAADVAVITISVAPYGRCPGEGGPTPALAYDPSPPNHYPIPRAGGPYTGVAGVSVSFDGRQSYDPDGNAISLAWDLGDGTIALGSTPSHTYARGKEYTVQLTVTDGYLTDRATTTASIGDAFPARAFAPEGQTRIRLDSGKPTLCVQIEPMNGSYSNAQVDLASIVMISAGTGSVGRIQAIHEKTAVVEDRDGNGVDEISACFRKEDLRQLFGQVGIRSAPLVVDFEGNLLSGGKVRAEMELTLLTGRELLSATVSPNPLNPGGTLTFSMGAPGRVTVRLYDLGGRSVRTVVAGEQFPAGPTEISIDGRDDRGTALATGVYFYRLETHEGASTGRFVVLK